MYNLYKDKQPSSAAEQNFARLSSVCTITNIIVSLKQNKNNIKHVPLKLNTNNQVILIGVTKI